MFTLTGIAYTANHTSPALRGRGIQTISPKLLPVHESPTSTQALRNRQACVIDSRPLDFSLIAAPRKGRDSAHRPQIGKPINRGNTRNIVVIRQTGGML
jgi:hypothetical protein